MKLTMDGKLMALGGINRQTLYAGVSVEPIAYPGGNIYAEPLPPTEPDHPDYARAPIGPDHAEAPVPLTGAWGKAAYYFLADAPRGGNVLWWDASRFIPWRLDGGEMLTLHWPLFTADSF